MDGTPAYGSGSPLPARASRGRAVSYNTPAASTDFVETGVSRRPTVYLL
ncbi:MULTISPECIES: hypothetical protein [Streptomyces]|nr:hypothetical protein [Streptomyces durhamensis]